ncbi:hypothetical protein VNO77_19367 [Canavalia gladiata]|uniref:Uncharacterized protein n=1 Tax=Canavalia gladiata TaxID=3824 RepID=A0AAN9LRE7_CANGL
MIGAIGRTTPSSHNWEKKGGATCASLSSVDLLDYALVGRESLNLALEAAKVRELTCPSSHSPRFPAFRSYNVCHGLLEELHEQNAGASFLQQGPIVLEFPSNHRSPVTLVSLSLCSYVRADAFVPLIHSEENSFAWCNATKMRRSLCAKLSPYHDPI